MRGFILSKLKEGGELNIWDLRQELLRKFRDALNELVRRGLIRLTEDTILIEPVPENLEGEMISPLNDVKPWVREVLEKHLGRNWREHIDEKLVKDEFCIECGEYLLVCNRTSPCEAVIVEVKKL